MISAKPAVMVAMLALAGTAVAQEKADEQRIAELIEQLRGLDSHLHASWELVRIGAPAVPALIDVLEAESSVSVQLKVIATLGRMRAEAVLALPAIMNLVPRNGAWVAVGSLSTAAITVLGMIGPAAKDAIPTLEKLTELDDPQLVELATATLRQIRQASVQDHQIAELIQSVRDGGSEIVARSLARFDAPVVDPLMDAIEAEAAAQDWDIVARLLFVLIALQLDGEHAPALMLNRACSVLERNGFDFSEIYVIWRPDQTTLIRMPDRDGCVRLLAGLLPTSQDARAKMEAVMTLGQLGPTASYAVPHLMQAANGPDQSIAREAITALGMIGPAAKDAIPTLEKLTEHEDRQLAERAKAALRQVRGR